LSDFVSAFSGSSGVLIMLMVNPFFSASSMILSTIAPPMPRSYFSLLSVSDIFTAKSEFAAVFFLLAFGVLLGNPNSFGA